MKSLNSRCKKTGILLVFILAGIIFLIIRKPELKIKSERETVADEAKESRFPSPKLESIEKRKNIHEQKIAQEEKDMIKRVNVRIQFWGKVVDQNSKPLEGVRISYRVGQPRHAWDSNTVVKNTTTGMDGLFYIEDSGDGFSFQAFQKEGYQQGSGMNMSFTYSSSPEKFNPKKTNPKTYTLIKAEEMQSLLPFSKQLVLKWDNLPVRYNLRTGKFDSSGEIEITARRGKIEGEGREARYDWSCKIQAIKGGIMETAREKAYMAPENGYMQFWEYGYLATDPQWKIARGDVHLVFHLPDGNYGRLELDINSEFESKISGRISSYLNPSGGRLLEYDASLKIK